MELVAHWRLSKQALIDLVFFCGVPLVLALLSVVLGPYAAIVGGAGATLYVLSLAIVPWCLTGLATQKVSRLIAKDKVTSFLRAPFTRYQEPSGHGELSEQPRGTGMRYAIGELLVCPYCMAQWVVAGFAVGWVHAPRTTRLLAAMWAAQSVADGAQLAYSAGEQQT
jgi:hypothetical protein